MIAEMPLGTLSVLNTGAGDMRFSFDSDDPLEVARASRVVEDMLRRGYMLFVEVGGKLRPVKKFDAKHACYIVADGPLHAADPVESVPAPEPERRGPGRPRKTAERRIPAKSTRATGVAPTAGG